MENELARAVLTADIKAQYDAQCKLVLSQKEVLAWILQGVAEEFAQMSVEEIKSCIEGTPEISSEKIYPGQAGERIIGIGNESRITGEGSIYYDIRFLANIPQGRERIRLMINVEAQKDYYPGYQLPTRGIFYCARMLSSQLGTEFSGSDYDGLKKVYSIWICMGVPKKIGNAIAEYRMERRDILPGFPDCRESYDKLSVVMIGLNGEEGGDGGLMGMLNTLLSPRIGGSRKKEILQQKYGMRMDDGLGREVDLMCNLSGYVEERGIQKGIEKGILQGAREGESRLAELICLLLQKGDYDGIRLAAEDENARREFYREYGLIG